MSEFDSREKAFEKKFELDEERRFRIASHAAHLFGAWAAGQMGLEGDEAEDSVVANRRFCIVGGCCAPPTCGRGTLS